MATHTVTVFQPGLTGVRISDQNITGRPTLRINDQDTVLGVHHPHVTGVALTVGGGRRPPRRQRNIGSGGITGPATGRCGRTGLRCSAVVAGGSQAHVLPVLAGFIAADVPLVFTPRRVTDRHRSTTDRRHRRYRDIGGRHVDADVRRPGTRTGFLTGMSGPPRGLHGGVPFSSLPCAPLLGGFGDPLRGLLRGRLRGGQHADHPGECQEPERCDGRTRGQSEPQGCCAVHRVPSRGPDASDAVSSLPPVMPSRICLTMVITPLASSPPPSIITSM